MRLQLDGMARPHLGQQDVLDDWADAIRQVQCYLQAI